MNKETFTYQTMTTTQQTPILVEGDWIVPEQKPDVSQILRCYATVQIDETKPSEEKVYISGSLSVTVLYRAQQASYPVYTMSTTLPIQEELYVESLCATDTIQSQAYVEHSSCTLINDRKIGVHAVVQICLQSYSTKTCQMLCPSQESDIAYLQHTIQTQQPLTEHKDRFTIKETLPLSGEYPVIEEVLDTRGDIINQEIRPMESKASLRGTVRVHILYRDSQTGMPTAVQYDIPFHGFLESNTLFQQSILDATVCLQELQVQPTVDEDGEARIWEISATVGATLCATTPTELQIVSDAYGLSKDWQVVQQQIQYPIPVGTSQNRFAIRETLSLSKEEPQMMQVLCTWGEVQLEQCIAHENEIEVNGALQLEVLYVCEQEPICVVQQMFPFQRTIELKGTQPEQHCRAKAVLEDIDVRLLTEREAEVRAQITIDVIACGMGTTNIVTDLQEMEQEQNQKHASAVIYIAQPQETLWEIAKKHHTTTTRIATINHIDEQTPLTQMQKLLILR